MVSNPTPNFQHLNSYNSLSTRKERVNAFNNSVLPPKAPIRSCPVSRIRRSIFKDDSPRPVSFREDANSSFISDSPLYATNNGTYFEQCYTIEKELGKGCFGEVFKVTNKESGLSYACKRTLLKYRSEIDRLRRIEEVKKHEQLPPHMNCVRFFRAWEENNHLYLLTEVCQNSLADIVQNNHEFTEYQLWSFLVDILQGLHHLHENHFIHMDLKPDNIFIGTDGLCKIGDFGLVIDFSNGFPKDALEGDSKYIAPECFQNIYTPAADIFSLGMVMLELAMDLFVPKDGPMWHELRGGNIPSLKSKGFSAEFEDFIRGLLEPNPAQRLTSSEALEFPSVTKMMERKRWQHYFRIKFVSAKRYLRDFLVWPLVVFSFVFSFVTSRVLDFRTLRKTVSMTTKNEVNVSGFEPTDSFSELDKSGKLNEDSMGTFSFLRPIINSTPISCVRKAKKHRARKSEPSFSCDEDEVDATNCGFNDSSFFSFELSHDEVDVGFPLSGAGSPINGTGFPVRGGGSSIGGSMSPIPKSDPTLSLTAKNLLDLFDAADLSDECCQD